MQRVLCWWTAMRKLSLILRSNLVEEISKLVFECVLLLCIIHAAKDFLVWASFRMDPSEGKAGVRFGIHCEWQEPTLRKWECPSAFPRTLLSSGSCPASLLCSLCSFPSLAPYRGWFPVISSLCCSNFVYFYTFNSLKTVWVKGQHSTTGKDLIVGFVAGN